MNQEAQHEISEGADGSQKDLKLDFYKSCPSCSRTDEGAGETATLQQAIQRPLSAAQLVVFVSSSACCNMVSLSGNY